MKKTFLNIFTVLFVFSTILLANYIPFEKYIQIDAIESILYADKVQTPQTLIIPSLNVHAPVESVGLDEEERMDVPSNNRSTAWYELGPKPGELGNAVISGHLDSEDTSPAVFYNLSELEVGDEISVIDRRNVKLTFSVIDKKVYDEDNFPIEEVFGPTDHTRLNLITCEGRFNREENTYTERIVIFSRLVSEEKLEKTN